MPAPAIPNPQRIRSDAPWWLLNPHLQTVAGALLRARLGCPAGRSLEIDHPNLLCGFPALWTDDPSLGEGVALLVIHGIGGELRSAQGVSLAHHWLADRLGPCLLFSLCPSRSQTPRLHHGGASDHLDAVVDWVCQSYPRVVVVGFSLGANVLVKWLAENPAKAERLLGSVAVCNPWDLAACGNLLEQSWTGRLYTRSMLTPLRRRALALAERWPDCVDLARIRSSVTLHQFDDAVTAPLHGFANADDYYRRSSSIYQLPRVESRLLCIDVEDDPFIAHSAARQPLALPPGVERVYVQNGGHIGLLGKRGRLWLEDYLIGRVKGWISDEGRRES